MSNLLWDEFEENEDLSDDEDILGLCMPKESEKEDYTLAVVENPLISPPHEETTIGGAQPKRTVKPTPKLL